MKAFPFLQFALNNTTSFATRIALNKLVLGFRSKDTISTLSDLLPEDIERLRPIKRIKAEDITAFNTLGAATDSPTDCQANVDSI